MTSYRIEGDNMVRRLSPMDDPMDDEVPVAPPPGQSPWGAITGAALATQPPSQPSGYGDIRGAPPLDYGPAAGSLPGYEAGSQYPSKMMSVGQPEQQDVASMANVDDSQLMAAMGFDQPQKPKSSFWRDFAEGAVSVGGASVLGGGQAGASAMGNLFKRKADANDDYDRESKLYKQQQMMVMRDPVLGPAMSRARTRIATNPSADPKSILMEEMGKSYEAAEEARRYGRGMFGQILKDEGGDVGGALRTYGDWKSQGKTPGIKETAIRLYGKPPESRTEQERAWLEGYERASEAGKIDIAEQIRKAFPPAGGK